MHAWKMNKSLQINENDSMLKVAKYKRMTRRHLIVSSSIRDDGKNQ